MTTQADWTGRTGQSWADQWQRTDRSFGALTDHLLHRVAQLEFHSILDIGCGAGELSAALARVNGHVRVIGVDVSEDLLGVARERGQRLPNLEFAAIPAERWDDPTVRPDLLVSRHGVMFFDSPIEAFAHLCRAAAPGARMLFSCFRPEAENAWVGLLDDVAGAGAARADDARPAAPSYRPGPFAFGDRELTERVLIQAGWSEPEFEPVDYAMIAGMGPDAVAEARAYFLRIGPAARAIAALEGDERAAAVARLERMLALHEVDGLVALPAAAWIVSARAPD